MAIVLNMHEIIEFMTNPAIHYLIMHDGMKFWEKPIVTDITNWIMLILSVIPMIESAIMSAITRSVQDFLHVLVTMGHIGSGGFHCVLAAFVCVLLVRHVIFYPLVVIRKVLRIRWIAPVGATKDATNTWTSTAQDPSGPSCICLRRSSSA